MSGGKEIREAITLLGLPERASMAEIKAACRTLLNQWHPDKCQADPQQCHEMTVRIVAASKVIMRYCSQYKYSFAPEELERHLSEQEWWTDRFGDDPLWGRR